MNEEEIIKEVKGYLDFEEGISMRAIQGLLNLYEKEKEKSAFNKALYENKKRDYLKLQAFYEKDYIRKDKIVTIIKELEKEQEENRRNLSLGIELLSNTIIDKFSDEIMINLGIHEYLENILKENKENG